jgi:hypothetical protein
MRFAILLHVYFSAFLSMSLALGVRWQRVRDSVSTHCCIVRFRFLVRGMLRGQ